MEFDLSDFFRAIGISLQEHYVGYQITCLPISLSGKPTELMGLCKVPIFSTKPVPLFNQSTVGYMKNISEQLLVETTWDGSTGNNFPKQAFIFPIGCQVILLLIPSDLRSREGNVSSVLKKVCG